MSRPSQGEHASVRVPKWHEAYATTGRRDLNDQQLQRRIAEYMAFRAFQRNHEHNQLVNTAYVHQRLAFWRMLNKDYGIRGADLMGHSSGGRLITADLSNLHLSSSL